MNAKPHIVMLQAHRQYLQHEQLHLSLRILQAFSVGRFPMFQSDHWVDQIGESELGSPILFEVVFLARQLEFSRTAFLHKTMEHITSLPLFRDGSIVASPSTEEEEDWLRLYGYLVCKYLVDGYRIDSISSHMCIILSIPEYKWKEHIRTH